MVSTKDLIDTKSSYSTTRWAFVVAMKFAIMMSIAAIVCFIVFKIFKIDTDGLFSGVTALLGVVVGLTTTAKALQGFETRQEHKDKEKETEIKAEVM